MKLLKDMVHKELQSKAIKKALNDFLGNIGSYIINCSTIICYIDKNEVEDYDKYQLNFVSINEIIRRAKNYYNNFDDIKINNICYVFEDINFYRRLELSARNSSIIFQKCKFYEGIMVNEANDIIINNNCVSSDSINIRANKLKINDLGLILSSDNSINITTRQLEITKSSIVCNTSDIKLQSNVISILDESYISANNLHIIATKLNVNNSKLIGKKSLEIFTQDNNFIDNINNEEDKILYSKLRIRLIENLKRIKNYKENNEKQMVK